jgi:predicted SprT family Zn-dependent metalloprotease
MIPELAEWLAREKMDHYGLKDWKFQFMYSHTDLGCCYYKAKIIELSIPLTLINDPGIVLNTVLHEIAHALSPRRGHCREWRAKAREIGAIPEAITRSEHGAKLLYNYSALCGQCGREYFANKYYRTSLCTDCYKMDRKIVIEWKENPWKAEVENYLSQ